MRPERKPPVIELRQIAPSDFEKLVRVHKKVITGILLPSKLDGYYCWVLSVDKRTAGWCLMKVSGGAAMLKCDFVLPQYRRRGLGEFMVRRRIEIAKAMGIKTVKANATQQAVGVHLKCGASAGYLWSNGTQKMTYTL